MKLSGYTGFSVGQRHLFLLLLLLVFLSAPSSSYRSGDNLDRSCHVKGGGGGGAQAGNEWSNILPKSSQARKKPPPPLCTTTYTRYCDGVIYLWDHVDEGGGGRYCLGK